MKDKISRSYLIGGVQINVSAPEYEDAGKLELFRNAPDFCDAEFDFNFVNDISFPDLPLIHSDISENLYSDGRMKAAVLKTGDGIMLKTQGDGKRFAAEFDESHPEYFGSHVVLKAMRLPELMLDYRAVFLHASFVKYGEKAILFTADKQVGKSTQAALWEEHMNSETVNGDRALLRKQQGKWKAFGSPYSGTSGICKNESAEIAAVVILGQATENRVCKASAREAIEAMMSGITYNVWNADEAGKCMDICSEIISEVPFLRLDCVPDRSAVEALRNAITEM